MASYPIMLRGNAWLPTWINFKKLFYRMDKKTVGQINKDLILRERLALERTIMTNNTTLLAFIRTSLYFAVAGLTLNNLLDIRFGGLVEVLCWIISFEILSLGIPN